MAMTLSDFWDEVRGNVRRDSNGLTDARITRWVNWAQSYLADLHTYEEMREVYDGSTELESGSSTTYRSRYGFPSRMKDIYSLTLLDGGNSRKLVYTNARHFDRVVPRPQTVGTGVPDSYIDYGINFELFPTPDAEYPLVLRCSRYPIDLSLSTDVSALLRKDALIAAVATTFGFFSLREVEDAHYWGSVIVPSLYNASILSDHSAEDWTPIARGFTVQESSPFTGEYWNNPFSGKSV